MLKNQHSVNSVGLPISSVDSVSGGLDWGSLLLGLWGVLIELHQFGKIELWLLEDLSLSDHAVVLKWVDFTALGLNLFANFFFQAIY